MATPPTVSEHGLPAGPQRIEPALPADAFRSDPFTVAHRLLGAQLNSLVDGAYVAGRIIELEVYAGGTDRAAHSYRWRRTARTEIQFAPGGVAYLFLVYGLHWQFNVVTSPEQICDVILIRALEPLVGREVMRQRRGVDGRRTRDTSDRALTVGPGRLCSALGLDRRSYGAKLYRTPSQFSVQAPNPSAFAPGPEPAVWISPARPLVPPSQVAATPRVGIDYAQDYASRPWRLTIKGHPLLRR